MRCVCITWTWGVDDDDDAFENHTFLEHIIWTAVANQQSTHRPTASHTHTEDQPCLVCLDGLFGQTQPVAVWHLHRLNIHVKCARDKVGHILMNAQTPTPAQYCHCEWCTCCVTARWDALNSFAENFTVTYFAQRTEYSREIRDWIWGKREHNSMVKGQTFDNLIVKNFGAFPIVAVSASSESIFRQWN